MTKDHPTVVKYRNELPTTHMFQHVIDLIRKPPFPADINVWNVVRQRGGYTVPQCDGLPEQAFSPLGHHAEDWTTLDPGRVKPNEAIYAYTNHDQSRMLWYHGHAMGMSAIDVCAGLAGLYVVRDPADDRLGLPLGEFEVPSSCRTGPSRRTAHSPTDPFPAVEPRRYRLRILNASNERFWRLRFDVPRQVLLQPQPPFWLIGTDGGLRAPLQMLDFLTVQPSGMT
ncbi:hypothetical protein ACFV2H_06640 [Streptomyces sp. NPDC059629]|uniref:hypothetical protein n=1 Tax=Streptomyces sp. NPDC059629 TaxID=3346889 RepID=UPI0036C4108B